MPNTNERDALTAEERAHVVGVLRRNHDDEFVIRVRDALAATAPNAGAPLAEAEIDALVDKFKAAARARPTAENSYGLRLWDSLKSDLRALLAAAPAQQADGFVLVPKRMTRAMERAIEEEGWQWADLLAAAGVITEAEHEAIQAAPAQQAGAITSSEPAFYISSKVLDPATGRIGRHTNDALTWDNKPSKHWDTAVYIRPIVAGAPLPLTEEQREDVLDALRNTHGLAGDVEEMLDAVLEEVAAVGAPLPLAPSEEDLCLLQRVDDLLGMFALGRYPYDSNNAPNQKWRRATISDVERQFKTLAPKFTALVVKLFKDAPQQDDLTPVQILHAAGKHDAADFLEAATLKAATRAQPQADAAPALHPATADLVARFARALAEKLASAQVKYGYSDGWLSAFWMDECRAKLLEHVAKGDPRDVAAYCAFLWHHGASTAAPQADAAEPVEASVLRRILHCRYPVCETINPKGHDWDTSRLDETVADLQAEQAQALGARGQA